MTSQAEERLPEMEKIVTREIVAGILKDLNPSLELVSFKTEPGTNPGDNLLSIMYVVDVVAENVETGVQETISIMLKTMPRNAIRNEMINGYAAFEKEMKMYTEVFGDFEEFQRSRGLEDCEVFRSYPRCYSTFIDGKADFIAMENLRVSGYQMANRQTGMDLPHIKLTLENFAKLHAVSAALFQGDAEAMHQKYPWLIEKMYADDTTVGGTSSTSVEMRKAYMSGLFRALSQKLREDGHQTEGDALDSLHDDQHDRKMHELVCGTRTFAVICHGDCWTNNFLFRYASDSDEPAPAEMKFVDFQLCRISSRTTDLHYYLYTSVPMDILNEKEAELLRHYHNHFKAFAQRLGYSNDQLTFEALQEEFNEFRYFGICNGVMIAPTTMAASEDAMDLDSVSEEDAKDLAAMAQRLFGKQLKNEKLIEKILQFAKVHIPKLLDRKPS